MQIYSAEYKQSFTTAHDIALPELPSIAFVGRSNAGKSTLMNNLMQRKNLVKTSSTPGKTQLINYFLINQQFYFVDLPGYGFTKMPVAVRKGLQNMIYSYITEAPSLNLVFHLIDARHKPSQEDYDFHEHLYHIKQNYCIIANKVDKIPKTKRNKAISDLQKAFAFQKPTILPHSSLEKIGTKAIWQHVINANSLVKNHGK